MKLVLSRKEYGDTSTLGDLYVDGEWESVTLEDAIQPNDVKIPGQTCIPDGTYTVVITPSPKFKRDLPLLVNVPGFDGIRIHPGNTPDDTAGCLLVGENYQMIAGVPFLMHSGRAFDRLFNKLFLSRRKGESASIEIKP